MCPMGLIPEIGGRGVIALISYGNAIGPVDAVGAIGVGGPVLVIGCVCPICPASPIGLIGPVAVSVLHVI